MNVECFYLRILFVMNIRIITGGYCIDILETELYTG